MILDRLPHAVRSRTTFVVVMSLFAASYVVGTTARAHQKFFWHDEIVMLTLARLPPPDLWSGLLDGTDLNPPLFHLIIHWWHGLFGEGAIVTRVPSIAGVALAALTVGLFVGRRLGPLAGFAGILILLGTDAYRYAYEARPYGVMLGFAGTAMVCWQAVAWEGASRWWLVGLFVSLAGAVSCHYYAVLLLPPLVLGEVVRSVESRRADWQAWSVLPVALFPLLLLWPLIRAARSFSSGYFSPPRLDTLQSTYESAFLDLLVPFIIASAVFGAALAMRGRHRDDCATGEHTIPAHEWAVAIGLLATPIIGYAMAVVVTGAFVPRYFLVSTIGFSILVPYLIASLVPHRQHVLVSVAAVLLLFLVARDLRSSRLLLQPSPGLDLLYPSLMKDTEESLPVVVTNGHVFAIIVHYAPRALVSRAVHLYTPESIRTGAGPRYLKGLSRWNPLIRLEERSAFLARHRRFLVYGPVPNAILSEVRRRGGRCVLRAVDIDRSMFAISRPGTCALFEVTFDEYRSPLPVQNRTTPPQPQTGRSGGS